MNMSIRDARQSLPRLEQIMAAEGEITITRHGRPIARIVPLTSTHRPAPSHAGLRASMPLQETPSEVLLGEERDSR